MADDDKATADEFDDLVNLTGKELEEWLETDKSKDVGQKKDGGESTGHYMGREIVDILRKKTSGYSDDDYSSMRKVTGYIKRHSAQHPKGDVEETRWRYSLMNRGQDPLKK